MFLLGKNAQQLLRRNASRGNGWRELAESIVSSASVLDGTDLPVTWEEGREVLLPTARTLALRSQSLVVAHVLTGEFSFLKTMLSDGLKAARLANWNPEHFLDTAEIAFAVACISKWSQPIASRSQLQELEKVLHERAVKRGLWSLRGGSNWTRTPGNWNIVCNAALTVVATALREKYPDDCTELLERAETSSRIGLSDVGPGGEWKEGVVYLDHSAQFAWFATLATGSSHFQPILDCGEFRAAMTGPSGMVADFGDDLPVCAPPAVGPTGATPAGSLPLNLLWGAPPTRAPDRYVGRTAASLRSGRHFLAVRLGDIRHAHAHADLGSFIWEANGCRLIADPGRLRYDIAGYFDPDTRFHISGVTEHAHNCIAFEAVAQGPATTARASFEDDTLLVTISGDGYILQRCFHLEADGSLTVLDRLVDQGLSSGDAIWTCHVPGRHLGDGTFDEPGGATLSAMLPGPVDQTTFTSEKADEALRQRCSKCPLTRIQVSLTKDQLRQGVRSQFIVM
ncbi:heparinase II/III domain-containing protein [Roseibium sediminicola]|uniref:Heparinase II/III-family protein n=1 Tax=Roseibium sediminicola TaxID=2933272 RepID=A0ABT0H2Z5_9HYPH|nr:heparinase II/III family protein [Roseibium sp. CAU 1639]MCK7616054.1 heparinase II/III-family protein [Roseibium sp. CAU 1639]